MSDIPSSLERLAYMAPGERLSTVIYDKLHQYRHETEVFEDDSVSSSFLALEDENNIPLTLGSHITYGNRGFMDSRAIVEVWIDSPEGTNQYILTGDPMEEPTVLKLAPSHESAKLEVSEVDKLTIRIEKASISTN